MLKYVFVFDVFLFVVIRFCYCCCFWIGGVFVFCFVGSVFVWVIIWFSRFRLGDVAKLVFFARGLYVFGFVCINRCGCLNCVCVCVCLCFCCSECFSDLFYCVFIENFVANEFKFVEFERRGLFRVVWIVIVVFDSGLCFEWNLCVWFYVEFIFYDDICG